MKSGFVVCLLVALGVGLAGGFVLFHSESKSSVDSTSRCAKDYSFINTGVACLPHMAIKKHEYTGFVAVLSAYIKEVVDKKQASEVSVYFRDLSYGPTFGIGEQARFVPASLLKLPLLITYLGLAEENPSLLQKKVSYTNTGNVAIPAQTEGAEIPMLQEHRPYTIDDLLSRMIIYSDNVSYWVLDDYLATVFPHKNPLTLTMVELGLVNPNNPNENTMTVKAYASLFRQLYNSSYLSPASSEKALALLSKSTYKKGLVAGVPEGVRVAHKFGERSSADSGEKQLHDCGIVYYADNPYLLCVMTRGKELDALSDVVKGVSERVYKEVDSRKY
jgi:beta-lactamase class A